MITIKVHQDAHGYSLNGKGRVRYVPKSLAGTVVESTALRQILCKTKDEASLCPARVPGDWPARETAACDIASRPEFVGVANY